MKTLLGAITLIIAANVQAQTVPAPEPKADHSQHQGMDHSQHQQNKHDCKECCEKMKSTDGKMECMDKKAEGQSAGSSTSAQDHEGHAH